jgi:hypothetical protein
MTVLRIWLRYIFGKGWMKNENENENDSGLRGLD